MSLELLTRAIRANNLARALDAIKQHDYPIAFHLLDATFGSVRAHPEDAGYYAGMQENEAALFRSAVNAAWQRELSPLSHDSIERMTADGVPLSNLDLYLPGSGLAYVRPSMSHHELVATLVRKQDDQAIWRYLGSGQQGPQQFHPGEIRDGDEFIATVRKRAHPALLWSNRVVFKSTATNGELFGWATIQINFGRKTQLYWRQNSLRLEHVNLRCTVDGYLDTEQPTGISVLDQTVEMSRLTGRISLSA